MSVTFETSSLLEKSGQDFHSHSAHLQHIFSFYIKYCFLFNGEISETKSIVKASPWLIFALVDISIRLSKWTIEQLGLQLCVNFINSGQIPKVSIYAAPDISLGLIKYLFILFSISLYSNFVPYFRACFPPFEINRSLKLQLKEVFCSWKHLIIFL